MAGLSCVHVPRAFLVSRKSFLVVGLGIDTAIDITVKVTASL